MLEGTYARHVYISKGMRVETKDQIQAALSPKLALVGVASELGKANRRPYK